MRSLHPTQSPPLTGRAAAGGGAMRRRSPYPYWFILPGAVIFSVFFLVPTVASFWFSLTRWDLFTATFIGFENFRQFFSEPFLLQGLLNTLIYAVVTSGSKTVLGLLLAVLLTSGIFAQGFLRTAIFFPVLVSFIGVGFTFNALMHPTRGAINVALAAIGIDGPGWLTDPSLALYSVALVDLWKGVGLATLIYIAGLATISPDFYEAARIDGATRTQMFWRVTVPLVRPATVTVVILSLIGGPQVLRPDLGDDARRPRVFLGRARERHLQAVPGRLLRAVHRRQRHPLPARSPSSSCR